MRDDKITQNKKSEITCRPENPLDCASIIQVWRDAFGADSIFGDQGIIAQHLDWSYSKNPDRREESICQWVAEEGGDVIAAWSTMPARLFVNGNLRDTCWLQNTAVAPRAQRRGIGRKMFNKIISHFPLTLGVGVVPASRALYVSEGAHFVAADNYVKIDLSIRSICKNILAAVYHRDFERASTASSSFVQQCKTLLENVDPNIDVNKVTQFDSSIDEFVQKIAQTIPIMMQRSAIKLNWYLTNPRLSTVAILATQNDSPCGYAVVRSDGLVLDLLVHPEDPQTFLAIQRYIRAWAKENKIKRLEAITPGFPALSEMYKDVGYSREEDVDFGLFYALSDLSEQDELLHDPKNWYLSLVDSDLWGFRLQPPPE